MHRREFLILGGIYLSVCVLYFLSALSVTQPGYPLDDSWIHQVFARNIATGHGFSFNPDTPISGATAPLWTLLMALLWPMTGPIAGGIIAGVILEFLAITGIFKLTLLITGQKGSAFLAALFSILTWVLIWGALSGMEIGLYSALSIWGLYFYFKAGSFEDKYNYLSYAFFALAFLSRPECALFLVAVMIRDIIIWVRADHKNIIPWLWRIAIPAIILLPYFAFNYSITGSLFTQTFAAKEQGRGLLSALANVDPKRIIKVFSVYPYYYFQNFVENMFVLIPLLLPAFVPGLFKFLIVNDVYRSKRIMLVGLLILYVPLMGTFAPVLNPTYHHLRLIDNIIPLYIMLGVAGFFWKTPPINKIHIKILLWLALILAVVGIFLLAADNFIVRTFGPYLLQNTTRMESPVEFDKLIQFVADSGRNSLFLALIAGLGAILCAEWTRRKLALRAVAIIIVVSITGYSFISILRNAGIYANDVKNINDMDVKVGLYLKDTAEKNQKVAVNDIGAIGYYSEATILDLKGLVSPEITPSMILDDSLEFEYMLQHDRVDYVAIFPDWFKYIPQRTDILKPIQQFGVAWNTILAGDTTIVYRAEWPDSVLAGQAVGDSPR